LSTSWPHSADAELEGIEAVAVAQTRKRAASSSGVMSRFIEA
jgi:hypothetical protein